MFNQIDTIEENMSSVNYDQKHNFLMDETDNIVDKLLKKSHPVYYINCIILNNNTKIIYSVAGCFLRRYSNFYFYPFPSNQVKTFYFIN